MRLCPISLPGQNFGPCLISLCYPGLHHNAQWTVKICSDGLNHEYIMQLTIQRRLKTKLRTTIRVSPANAYDFINALLISLSSVKHKVNIGRVSIKLIYAKHCDPAE